MKIVLHGTSSSEGFPAAFCNCQYCTIARKHKGKNNRKRTCTSIDDIIMIDFGPDAFAQSQEGLDLSKIQHLFVTHSHADHFAPLDLHYLTEPFSDARSNQFNIYGNNNVLDKYNVYHQNNDKLNKIVQLHKLNDNVSVHVLGYTITPIYTYHDAKEECFLFIIEKDGSSILYAHDSACFLPQTFDALKNHHFSLVVMDCTSLAIGGHFKNHMGLPDVKNMQKKMMEINCITADTPIVVTHFAHTFNPTDENATKLAKEYGFIAASDGISFTV